MYTNKNASRALLPFGAALICKAVWFPAFRWRLQSAMLLTCSEFLYVHRHLLLVELVEAAKVFLQKKFRGQGQENHCICFVVSEIFTIFSDQTSLQFLSQSHSLLRLLAPKNMSDEEYCNQGNTYTHAASAKCKK